MLLISLRIHIFTVKVKGKSKVVPVLN